MGEAAWPRHPHDPRRSATPTRNHHARRTPLRLQTQRTESESNAEARRLNQRRRRTRVSDVTVEPLTPCQFRLWWSTRLVAKVLLTQDGYGWKGPHLYSHRGGAC